MVDALRTKFSNADQIHSVLWSLKPFSRLRLLSKIERLTLRFWHTPLTGPIIATSDSESSPKFLLRYMDVQRPRTDAGRQLAARPIRVSIAGADDVCFVAAYNPMVYHPNAKTDDERWGRSLCVYSVAAHRSEELNIEWGHGPFLTLVALPKKEVRAMACVHAFHIRLCAGHPRVPGARRSNAPRRNAIGRAHFGAVGADSTPT